MKQCWQTLTSANILTGVAIATPTGNRAYLEEIDVVEDWGPGMGNSKKIPSVISYSLKTQRNEQQWGADLSPQAIAMVHTKLQLDVVEAAAELDLVLQSLDGMYNLDFGYIKSREGKPKYTCKGPEEIVEDYLTHVFTYLLQAVSAFTTELRREIPVDIVATIPAVRDILTLTNESMLTVICSRSGDTGLKIQPSAHLWKLASAETRFQT